MTDQPAWRGGPPIGWIVTQQQQEEAYSVEESARRTSFLLLLASGSAGELATARIDGESESR